MQFRRRCKEWEEQKQKQKRIEKCFKDYMMKEKEEQGDIEQVRERYT